MVNFSRLSTILAMIALASTALEAAVVRGRVDRQTSYGITPAGSVKVTLKRTTSDNTSSPAFTDPRGYYYIYNALPGSYVLEVWNGPNRVTSSITVGNIPVFNAPTVTIR